MTSLYTTADPSHHHGTPRILGLNEIWNCAWLQRYYQVVTTLLHIVGCVSVPGKIPAMTLTSKATVCRRPLILLTTASPQCRNIGAPPVRNTLSMHVDPKARERKEAGLAKIGILLAMVPCMHSTYLLLPIDITSDAPLWILDPRVEHPSLLTLRNETCCTVCVVQQTRTIL
jgi:hypothetical protein